MLTGTSHGEHETDDERCSIIIVGLGVFGLSLLRYIRGAGLEFEAIGFDSKEEGSAGNDTHKIVRRLYTSTSRTATATTAQKAWEEDKVLKEFYYKIGRVEITDDITKLDAIDTHTIRPRYNVHTIHERLQGSSLSLREASCLKFASNVLEAAKDSNLVCLWNEDNAVIDWNACMQKIRTPLKCEIYEVKVKRLLRGDDGRISGLVLGNENVYSININDKVILTAGAWGPELLEASGISTPPREILAVGVFTFHLKLNEVHLKYLEGTPAISFQTRAINCEFLPPLHSHGLAKLGLTLPFKNINNRPEDITKSNLMYRALLNAIKWLRQYYPGLKGAEIVSREVHWDGITEDQTPLISWHPEHENLGIVWGGSFTRAKDFPIIGHSIFDILIRRSSLQQFAWDRTTNDNKSQHDQPALWIADDFQTLEEKATVDEEVQVYIKLSSRHYI